MAGSSHEQEDGLYEDDYYAMLNVSRTVRSILINLTRKTIQASIEEINRSFRQRSLVFHPDRHMDEQLKKDAEQFFIRLRKAHDTLTDPHLRVIYDTLGVKGLQVAGWEIITRTLNAEDIKKEYDFLCRLRDAETMMEWVNPNGSFALNVNVTDLFRSEKFERLFPEITGMSVLQSVDIPITSENRMTMSGQVSTNNGRGFGGFSLAWKKQISQLAFGECQIAVNRDVSLSSKWTQSVSDHFTIEIQPSTFVFFDSPLLKNAFEPSLLLGLGVRMSYCWHGSLVINLGTRPSIRTRLICTDFGRPRFTASVNVAPTLYRSDFRASYTYRVSENDAFYRLSTLISPMGIVPRLAYERKLTNFSRIGCSLKAHWPTGSISAKFRLIRGSYTYDVNVDLCDGQIDVPRATLYGLAVPLIFFHLIRLALHPWHEQIASLFERKFESRQVDQLSRDQAHIATELLRSSAERISKDEEQKMGLIILEGKFGEVVGSDGVNINRHCERTVDVTIALQALVFDSKLLLYDADKSKMPGFYDPCPGEKKLLRVRYLFRGNRHLVTVKEDQPLCIPKQSHRI